MVKKLLQVLRGQAVSPPPVWLMRQAGRYLPEYRALRANAKDFVQFCLTPELAIDVTLQPVRRFHLDAAILFADILLVPHALGQKVWFAEGEGPRLDPIRDSAGLAKLSYDAGEAGAGDADHQRRARFIAGRRHADRFCRRALDGGDIHDRRPGRHTSMKPAAPWPADRAWISSRA